MALRMPAWATGRVRSYKLRRNGRRLISRLMRAEQEGAGSALTGVAQAFEEDAGVRNN